MKGGSEAFNIAVGERTSLNELFRAVVSHLALRFPHVENCGATYRDFRAGDVRHSLADISKARSILGYSPSDGFRQGLVKAMDWYVSHFAAARPSGSS
jgi:UDP-N-acetylglucosamine/UDP-N-acetylgalactosamine 4-epimerase